MKTLSAVLVLAMAASALAQDGGKLAWRGKNEDPKAALADARSQGRAALLFFTSLGCKYCKQISDGAFSDPDVVDAASGLTCVFVDCDWGKKNDDLAAQFKVTGYPTIAFCDPGGKDIGRLQNREPAAVLRQIREITRKYPAGPGAATAPAKPVFSDYVAGALPAARKAGKLVLLFFYDDSPASAAVTQSLSDPLLREFVPRAMLTQAEFRKDSDLCARFDVSRAPTILVLDPAAREPEKQPKARITGSRSARELHRDFEEAFGAAPAPDVAAPRIQTPAPVETLSDDEVDRKFITARFSRAIDLVKNGKKAMALEVLEDILKTFPKHVETLAVKKYLDELTAQK
jgi:hypothetical protein